MSGCENARRWLLRADPPVLRASVEASGSARTPRGPPSESAPHGGLAAHLASCPACAAAARRILEETAALDRALASLDPGTRARPGAEVSSREAPPTGEGGGRGRRWPAVALAAALAGLILLRPEAPSPETPEVRTRPAAGSRADRVVRVRAPETGRLAVFETRDPTMTVVWFLP